MTALASGPSRTVCVAAILSTNEAGGAIFSGRDADGKTVRVVADHKVLPRVPALGETWTVEGATTRHAKYGEQVRATRCSWHLPEGQLLTRYLADSPAFAGLGEVKAQRLWDTFGATLADVLSAGDVARLTAVLTEEMATKVVGIWAEKRAEGELMAYLDRHGFDLRLASKIRRCWGDDALAMLEKNPYFLLAFARWKSVDAAGAKLCIPRDDGRRLVGAVESCLYDRIQDSHTVTSHDVLAEMLRKRLPTDHPEVAIQHALDAGAMVGLDDGRYQPIGAAALECGIAERLRRMMAGEEPVQLDLLGDGGALTDDWVRERIDDLEKSMGITFNAEQRAAVAMAATRQFCVMTGGAGVGKTTVLKACIDIAKRLDIAVFQLALAGRAAKRMAEATGEAAMTIAKFLLHVRGEKLEVPARSMVIVDEASMLDLPTTFRLLSCIPEGARLMLVGDPAQLPPIGFGLVLHRLAQSATVPRTNLVQVHRQAASTGIPAIADDVRNHRVPVLKAFDGCAPGVSFIDAMSTQVLGVLAGITETWTGDDWQILCAVKDGPAGINAINGGYHDANPGVRLPGWHIAVGDPVIHLVNDYDRGLMNGTLGVVTGASEAVLAVEFDGDEHLFPVTDLVGRIELAYAISVHKAQGSQFKRVAIAVTKSRLLDHALIYTALTRGVEQVVLVGDRAALEQAVRAAPLALRRDVALAI